MTRRRAMVGVCVLAVVAVVVLRYPFVGGPLIDSVRTRPDDTGCDRTPPGPAALVAFDLATGTKQWDQTIGRFPEVARTDNVLTIRGERFERTVDMSSGQITSCDEAPPQTVEEVAAALPAVPARPPPERDPRPQLSVPTELDLPVDEAALQAQQRREPTAPLVTYDLPWQSMQQRVGLAMFDLETSELLWRTEVPGHKLFVLYHHGADRVLVVDQTRGTGEFTGLLENAMLTSYSGRTGEQQWQIPIAGVGGTLGEAGSQEVALGTGTVVQMLDTATGEEIWQADHGSPGQGGFFSVYQERGGYSRFWVADADQALIGLIEAEETYRD